MNNGVREAIIEGRTTINFSLGGTASSQNNKQDNNEADKAVNIGYGSVDPKNLTTQVNRLDVKDNKYASYSNIYEVLRGTVPGVQVSGKSIRIQGASSLMLSTEPLFVVDGIVVSSIDDIIPNQISSVEVLKGSSASIYGSRGANGVILINLRNGSEKEK
ncbi:MAG: TonB-dependent receptor plug domain-containing protein [Bacteroidetes bacterium]|nr:TonB-dependent receptor plug domain-containing protein [Bacteroidota bacterium]